MSVVSASLMDPREKTRVGCVAVMDHHVGTAKVLLTGKDCFNLIHYTAPKG